MSDPSYPHGPRGDTDTATESRPVDPGVHRYDSPHHPDDDQAARPTPAPYGAPPQGPWSFGPSARPERPRPSRPSLAAVVLMLVAALVVGGAAGFVGAADFSTVDSSVGSPTVSGSTASAPTVPQPSAAAGSSSTEKVASFVLPSVVKITVRNAQEEGSGSGIILSADGEILTNNHVASIAGQNGSMTVNFNDGTTKRATLVGTDPLTDLAVIKAQGVSGLKPATIDKSGALQVGENVVAVGSPFGLQATVTTGIISALNRPVSVMSSTSGSDTTYPAIQTDAAINPGNSGGPLVNMNGQVVGINSSIRSASATAGQAGSIGLGFAIPIANVLPIVDQLRQGQTATHARLGITVADATSNNGLLTGAGVRSVTSDSAGGRAGLQRGDVITNVDGQLITSAESLIATIRGHRPGDTATLTVSRNGATKTLTATLESDRGSTSS